MRDLDDRATSDVTYRVASNCSLDYNELFRCFSTVAHAASSFGLGPVSTDFYSFLTHDEWY